MKLIRNKIKNLGNSIDNAFDNNNAELLRKLINNASLIVNKGTNTDEQAVIDYFIGNAWSDLNVLNNYGKKTVWSYERIEHINAIKYFRKCVSNINVSEEIKAGIFLQAYTNIGNMFLESGRVIYAIESWKKALRIKPSFGMARCNLSHGIIYYANNLYDRNHKALILRHCHNELLLFLKQDDIHEKARIAFETDLSRIRRVLNVDFLKKQNSFREYSLGRSQKERNYRKWVLTNSLYLNPLNDIFFDTAIAHDVLQLPNMRVRDYKAPVFHGFFNQLKQEYITARYLYYQYKEELPESVIHYSDKDRKLVNTLDYPQYGFRYEQLKNAFKTLYSILDKVGYFINEYFKLGIDRDRVYFRSIWYKDRQINPKIESLNNNPLRGLYFLSKDFYAKDMEYLELAEPDAKDIADLRNNIEHKYFKIHWIKPKESDGELRFDSLAYSIDESDFEKKVYRLLRCAREALIYLSLSIHIEEKKNEKDDGIVMPLQLFDYD